MRGVPCPARARVPPRRVARDIIGWDRAGVWATQVLCGAWTVRVLRASGVKCACCEGCAVRATGGCMWPKAVPGRYVKHDMIVVLSRIMVHMLWLS